MLFALKELVHPNAEFDPNVFWTQFFTWLGTVATVGIPAYFAYRANMKRQQAIDAKLDAQNVKAEEDGKAVAAAAVNSEAVAKKAGVTGADIAEATRTIAVKKEIVAAQVAKSESSGEVPKP